MVVNGHFVAADDSLRVMSYLLLVGLLPIKNRIVNAVAVRQIIFKLNSRSTILHDIVFDLTLIIIQTDNCFVGNV